MFRTWSSESGFSFRTSNGGFQIKELGIWFHERKDQTKVARAERKAVKPSEKETLLKLVVNYGTSKLCHVLLFDIKETEQGNRKVNG